MPPGLEVFGGRALGTAPARHADEEEIGRGFACAMAEAANEVRGTDLCFLRQVIQSEIAFKVGLDEFDASPQDGGGQTSGGVLQCRGSGGVMTQEIASQGCSHAIEKEHSTLKARALFAKQDFRQTAQRHVLKQIAGLELRS